VQSLVAQAALLIFAFAYVFAPRNSAPNVRVAEQAAMQRAGRG
jgi:hypothetical protein